MNLRTLLLQGLVAGLIGGTSMPALASHWDFDSVSMSPVSPGCGAQTLTFSGTAQYSSPTQHLVVTLDGTQLLHDHSEPVAWSTSPVPVSEGSHTLLATIYDEMDDTEHKTVEAQDTLSVTVPPCTSEPATGSSATGSSDGSGASDEQIPAPLVKGAAQSRVHGARVKTLSPRLKPLNEIFQKVHKRTPTFREWSYWANRLLTDKPQYDALYGAMQWHQLRGHTIGT